MTVGIAIDTFVQKNNIDKCDLIKVDIEGAELDFFLGGINFITRCRPIILSEFNEYSANEFGYEFIDIAELARSWDYDLYKQVGRKNFIKVGKPLIGLNNFLMIPKEKPDNILDKLGCLQE
jgi:hypothetical protein